MRALCGRRHVPLDADAIEPLRQRLPDRLTPGAAEALAVKAYRLVRTESCAPIDAVRRCLDDYRPAVSADVMALHIQLAVGEASDTSFIPAAYR